MIRIENLHIRGYRRLLDLNLPMRPLCVMIGANGSGKTSILEVLSVLAAAADGKLPQRIRELGGFFEVLTMDRRTLMSLQVSLLAPAPLRVEYALNLEVAGPSFHIADEVLRVVERPGQQPSESRRSAMKTEVSPQTGFPEMPGPQEAILANGFQFSANGRLMQVALQRCRLYHQLDVQERAPIRLPQSVRPADLPGTNGEDLVACMYSMREEHRNRYDAVEDALAAAFPGFVRLEFPSVADGTLAMAWRDRGFARSLHMNQLSEGMLRFLWLVTLLQSPGLSGLTMIDEPETSLHPRLLSLLADLLREAAEHTQLIVATHSESLIRFLKPDEVLTLNTNDEGMVEAQWADQLDLQEWLKEYTLDEVWRTGQLGARG